MFGYVRADFPYLFIKDETLYRAMYCGVCKGIGQVCGHTARIGLSYDTTFLSIIFSQSKFPFVKFEFCINIVSTTSEHNKLKHLIFCLHKVMLLLIFFSAASVSMYPLRFTVALASILISLKILILSK